MGHTGIIYGRSHEKRITWFSRLFFQFSEVTAHRLPLAFILALAALQRSLHTHHEIAIVAHYVGHIAGRG